MCRSSRATPSSSARRSRSSTKIPRKNGCGRSWASLRPTPSTAGSPLRHRWRAPLSARKRVPPSRLSPPAAPRRTRSSKSSGAKASGAKASGAKAPLRPSCRRLHLQRHHRGILRASQRQRGLHVAHVRLGGEPRDEILKRGEIGRDTFQEEIDLARKHPAFPHERFAAHEILERLEIGFGLARQMHHGKNGDLVAELLFVEQRPVALDVARLLKRTDTAKAGRRGNADPARELDIGDSTVLLQLFQDLAVDGVEAGWQGGLQAAFGPRIRLTNLNRARPCTKDYCAIDPELDRQMPCHVTSP